MTVTINGTTGLGPASVPQTALGPNVTTNGPAFSVYRNATQLLPTGTYSVVQLNTEEFDTAAAFDSTTNYRFQPAVAGYYLITGQAMLAAAAGGVGICAIFKNGNMHKRGSLAQIHSGDGVGSVVTTLMYFNGTTDYIDLRVFQSSGGNLNLIFNNAGAENRLDGFLARAA